MVVSVQTFSVFPNITLSELERILEHLPEPTEIEVLLAYFDYSDVFRQAGEVIEGIKLQPGAGSCTFYLENPSKRDILTLYKQFNEWLGKADSRRGKGEPTRVISLERACWNLDGYKVHVRLTPGEVVVKYKGQEPDYISRMKQALAGTRVLG